MHKEAQISICFALQPALLRTQGCQKSEKVELHWNWLPQSDLEHLNSQMYFIYTKYLPVRPNFSPFCLTSSRFRDINSSKIVYWMALNWTWTLNSHPLYTKYLPWCPNLGLFCSTTSPFDIQVVENRKYIEHLTVQSTLHQLSIYPGGPNFGPFHSSTSCFPGKK